MIKTAGSTLKHTVLSLMSRTRLYCRDILQPGVTDVVCVMVKNIKHLYTKRRQLMKLVYFEIKITAIPKTNCSDLLGHQKLYIWCDSTPQRRRFCTYRAVCSYLKINISPNNEHVQEKINVFTHWSVRESGKYYSRDPISPSDRNNSNNGDNNNNTFHSLTALSAGLFQTIIASNVRITRNTVLERILKQGVTASFKVLLRNSPGESEENHEKPQDGRCPDRDLILALPE